MEYSFKKNDIFGYRIVLKRKHLYIKCYELCLLINFKYITKQIFYLRNRHFENILFLLLNKFMNTFSLSKC